MATYAIGDIHGWREPLDELLAVLHPRLTDDDTVVFLGDYIDRGDDTKGCIEALLAFKGTTPARVVFLAGNHEEWLLQTMADHCRHSWLMAMDGYTTIHSYSPAAAEAIRDAVRDAGRHLLNGDCPLPYEQFFAAIPDEHQEFLSRLNRYCQTPDCICAHGGLHPTIPDLTQQGRILTWGHARFPDDYTGEAAVVYGHYNDPDVDAAGWPWPRMVGRTYGLDTISHGVLTAIALPGVEVIQSARYDYAVRRDD